MADRRHFENRPGEGPGDEVATPHVISTILGHYAHFWIFWREFFVARKKRLAARGSRLGLAGSQNSLPQKNWVGVYSMFQTKIFDFLYAMSDLAQNSMLFDWSRLQNVQSLC